MVNQSFDDDTKRAAWNARLNKPPERALRDPRQRAVSEQTQAEAEGAAVLAFMAEQEAFKKQLGKG